jgi:hypothetical protein
MEPDPIRQAYDDYVRKVGLRDDPKYCSFVEFTAGAKWAALDVLKFCEEQHLEWLHDKIRIRFKIPKAPAGSNP